MREADAKRKAATAIAAEAARTARIAAAQAKARAAQQRRSAQKVSCSRACAQAGRVKSVTDVTCKVGTAHGCVGAPVNLPCEPCAVGAIEGQHRACC